MTKTVEEEKFKELYKDDFSLLLRYSMKEIEGSMLGEEHKMEGQFLYSKFHLMHRKEKVMDARHMDNAVNAIRE